MCVWIKDSALWKYTLDWCWFCYCIRNSLTGCGVYVFVKLCVDVRSQSDVICFVCFHTVMCRGTRFYTPIVQVPFRSRHSCSERAVADTRKWLVSNWEVDHVLVSLSFKEKPKKHAKNYALCHVCLWWFFYVEDWKLPPLFLFASSSSFFLFLSSSSLLPFLPSPPSAQLWK